MKDVIIRAVKTFVQAFLGILIPELCVILQSPDLPVDITGWRALLLPLIGSALAAGISAVWNGVYRKATANREE